LRVVPEEMVGRVFGAVRLFVLCGMAPGIAFFGYAADKWGPHTAMTLSALGYLAIALAAVLSPAIREERR
jgi:MFS family permease